MLGTPQNPRNRKQADSNVEAQSQTNSSWLSSHFSYIVTLEVSHSDKRFFIIYPMIDYFCGSILVDSVKQLVLYNSEKHLVISLRGHSSLSSINVRNLLVKIAPTATNIPDTLQ